MKKILVIYVILMMLFVILDVTHIFMRVMRFDASLWVYEVVSILLYWVSVKIGNK